MNTRQKLALLLGALVAPSLPGTALAAPCGPTLVPNPVAHALIAPDLRSDRAAVHEELMTEIADLIELCRKKKLFAARAALYELILGFDTDDADARKGLGFTKQKDGTWKLKPRHRAPKDKSKKLGEDVTVKRLAAVKAYTEHLLAVADSYKDSISDGALNSIFDEVLRMDPDNAHVHTAHGEMKDGDLWVLSQTFEAKERRGVLRGYIRAAFASLPAAAPVEPNAREAAMGLPWSAVYTSPVARAIGTGSGTEIERLNQAMWVTHEYFNSAFKSRAKLPKNLTVFTMATPADGMTFVNGHPDVDDDYKAQLRTLEGSGIMGTDDFAQWAPNEQRRLDGLVRQAVAWLFASGFQVTTKHGWAFEGLGLYLTRELVGTRLTWFVGGSAGMPAAEEQAFRRRLIDPKCNWINEAYELVKRPNRPQLNLLLAKTVGELTPEDLLYSYALAAYLIEAESVKLPTILTMMGKGTKSVAAIQSVLGIDVLALDERLRRWLSERLVR